MKSASAPARQGRNAAAYPGLWPFASSTVLAALVCWFWLLPQLTKADQAALAPGVRALSEVAPDDLPGALATVQGLNPSAFAAQRQDRTCAQKLAWITLVYQPGQPPAKIRIRSGTYFSPLFTLADTPVRVAIPYPAPYETGRGVLSVLNAGAEALIALNPVWHVPATSAEATTTVVWQPVPDCPRPHG